MGVATTSTTVHSEASRVIEIDPCVDPRWDSFVRASDSGTFCHLGAWSQVLRRTYHYRPYYLAVENPASNLVGLLPLFFVRSPLTGRKLVSLPFSDVCGPLTTNQEDLRTLLGHACTLREICQAKYLQIRSSRSDLTEAEPRLTTDARYLDFVLRLSDGPAAIWSNPVAAKARTHIRKAIKSDVAVQAGETEHDLRAFYALHLKTTKKHGMPAQPYAYFRNFWEILRPACAVRLLLARHLGRVVAASLFVGFGDCVQYAYNASEPDSLIVGPNYLILWQAIQWACEAGYGRFSFGKTSRENEGLVHFKRGWGADEIPIVYYYHPEAAGLTSTNYGERSARYQTVTQLWRTLPAPITNALGGLLYGHLA